MSINGIRIVKSGHKSAPLNLSNARRKTYAELQNMTAEQKKGVIICSDYPTEPVSGANIEYSSGVSVNDAIDGKTSKSGDTISGDLTLDKHSGTTSSLSTSDLILGNSIPQGTEGNSIGRIDMYGYNQYRTRLYAVNQTANRNIELPDKSGTVALTSDIKEIKTVTISITPDANGRYIYNNTGVNGNGVRILALEAVSVYVESSFARINGNHQYVFMFTQLGGQPYTSNMAVDVAYFDL